jgi:UDP-N-acetylglucosamine--N-acetylmuramyl-(pentapeptide) pyrophosphoryl-undecaprenol N-acetylglucosamine transferase
VHWLGTAQGLEARLVPAAGIPLHCLEMRGLRGKGLKRYGVMPFVLIKAIWRAMKLFSALRPVCVIGMGGYAAAPGGVAAALRRTPLLLHEQNAVAGLTNRALAPLAKTILSAYPNQLTAKRGKVVGNPLRGAITDLPEPTARFAERAGSLRLLVLGGSLGAKALNEMVPAALGLADTVKPVVWHQAGRAKVEATVLAYDQAGFDVSASEVDQTDEAQVPPVEGVQVSAFISDMPAAYAWADLVVCRAGALTVSEISAAGLAAIFVPYPYAVDDHQTHNAQFLVDAGAAVSWRESDLTPERLAHSLAELLVNREQLLARAERARAVGQLQSAVVVTDAIEAAVQGD